MHYFQFNIGDYASHTRHLSPIEDLAYRRMIDLYYLHERPLNECSTTVQRQIGMRDYPTEVDAVLREFFTLEEGRGWVSKRIEDDIVAFQAKRDVAVKAGQASGRARSHRSAKPSNGRSTPVQQTLNDRSTDVEPTTNQEPRNQGTIVQSARRRASTIERPEDVEEGVWQDWVEHRRRKRAGISKTAVEMFRKEAKAAGMTLQQAIETSIGQGWQGFQAGWKVDASKGGTPKRRVADGGDWTGNSEPIQEI